MTRVLAAPALAALVALPAAGQLVPPPSGAHVIKLTTRPATAPVPVMRYEFVPRATQRTPGNAAADYTRALLLVPPWPPHDKDRRALAEATDRWMGAPLDALPVAEVTAYLQHYAAGFAALDAGALRDHCAWRAGEEPDLQKLRDIGRLNLLRVRRDLARGDFEAAARAIRSGVQFAKRAGEGTTTFPLLIGLSLGSMAWGDAMAFVGRPGSPNLYWALAALPRPLIDIRPGLERGAAALDAELATVAELEKGPVAVDAADRAAAKMYAAAMKWEIDGPPPAPPTGAALAARVAKAAPAARAFLVAHGRRAGEVENLPSAQAVVLAVILARRVYREELYAAFLRPYPQVWPEVERVRGRATAFQKALADPLMSVVAAEFQVSTMSYNASVRVERRFALLQAVEAVRLHAAANGGRAPAKLADVTAVPLPADPYTGRPFEYAVRPGGFTLTAPPPDGEQAHQGNSIRFEVTLRVR